MKKPYLKQLQKIGNITVWMVDGEFVRDHLNEEFTNAGQHYRFSVIPTNEFWLDKEFDPGEAPFYMHHLLVEWRLMRRGVSYVKALAYADRSERAERKKSGVMKRLRSKRLTEDVMNLIHKKKLATYQNGLVVWLVRGELVRDFCYTDFTEGGHDYVYKFVPKNEVWIDDDLNAEERSFVLLHEVHERRLMADGMDYHHAHASASRLELRTRKESSVLKKRLADEILLNKKKTTRSSGEGR